MQPAKHTSGLSILLAALWLLLMPFGFAQTAQEASTDVVGNSAEAGDTGVGGDSTKAGGSAEVEHNEENYRRFMELRDRGRRTSDLPTNAYQPGSQKLDQLPESSQKHLRNELREVIVKEGEWQEGDENKRYAYVPSEAAEGNRSLQLQEAEAWDELVEKYQEREAQIYKNATRSEAARQAANAALASGSSESSQSGSQSGARQGSEAQGMGAQGQSAQAGESGQMSQQSPSESRSDRAQNNDSSASRSAQQSEAREAGVSENALQFLTQSQSTGQSGSQPPAPPNSQSGSQQSARQVYPSGSQPPAQQISQQDSLAATQQDQQQTSVSEQPSQSEQLSQSEQSAEAVQPSAPDAEKEGTEKEGAEKEGAENMVAETAAQQSSVAPSQPPPVATPAAPAADEVSKAGATQNALEALSRGISPAAPSLPPADTLSIEDLSNAQGVAEEDPPDSD